MKNKLFFLIIFFYTFTLKSEDLKEPHEDIDKIIREFILNNPETIIESLENFRERQELKIQSKIEDNIKNYYFDKTYENYPFIGKEDSKIIITEFIDYNCGYCKKIIDTINNINNKMDDVKIVFIDFPILSESSELAAKASLASHQQNVYFEFHSQLLRHKGPIEKKILIEIAKNLKLDIKKFELDMFSENIANQLIENKKIASTLNIRGTPTFIVGDKILAGAYDYKKFQAIINNERKGL